MPPGPEILAELCQQGFEDGLRFLQRYNVISCNHCVQLSQFEIQETLPQVKEDSDEDFDPECGDCNAQRKLVSKASLPDTVVQVLREGIESANKGLVSWFFNRKVNVHDYIKINPENRDDSNNNAKTDSDLDPNNNDNVGYKDILIK